MSPARIAVWSGPRSLSTAMMRAWGSRPDTVVVDEPFYAYYLHATGKVHPMRAEVLASQPTAWQEVVARLGRRAGAGIQMEKHMAHHLLPEVDRSWLDDVRNVLLVRDPVEVLSSYADRHEEVTLDDLGLPQQVALFEELTARTGAPPPVLDVADLQAHPRAALTALCAAVAVPFDERMLRWEPGPRATDGVWAPHWYEAVLRSTGFATPTGTRRRLPPALAALAEEAAPLFARLRAHRLPVEPVEA